jgi:hypothetical protein
MRFHIFESIEAALTACDLLNAHHGLPVSDGETRYGLHSVESLGDRFGIMHSAEWTEAVLGIGDEWTPTDPNE